MNSGGGGCADSRGEVGLLPWSAEESPVDAFWPDVEVYLSHSSRAIRTGKAEDLGKLRDPKYRMNWYMVVYSACGGHPRNSRDVYNRFSLFLVNDLEANVLRPLLQKATSCTTNSFTLCQEFVVQYKAFLSFRRVVLSCLGYLDQHHVIKFQLDPLRVLCLKMFYLVVLQPLKESLVDEIVAPSNPARMAHQSGAAMSPACVAVQETLASIVEILSVIPPTSKLSSCALELDRATEGASNFELDEKTNVSLFKRICALVKAESTPTDAASHKKGGKSMEKSPAKNVPLDPVLVDGQSAALQEIQALRERIKSRSSAYLLLGMMSASNIAVQDSYAGMAEKEQVLLCVVNSRKPLYILAFATFGIRYVLHVEAYYRDQRMLQISQVEGRCGYMSWVRESCDFEGSQVKNLNVPHLHDALHERMSHVLLVDFHRQIILDDDFGFRAQLDAWDWRDGRNSNNMLPKSLSQTNDGENAPVAFASVDVKNPWEKLSEDEIAAIVREFVTIFINTRDEACGTLLATELADKVVADTALLFCAYFAQLKAQSSSQAESQQKQQQAGNPLQDADRKRPLGGDGPSSAAARPQPDAAMTLIDAIVDLAIRYDNLIRKQFGGYVPMQVELRNAFWRILHPNRWSQLLTSASPLEKDAKVSGASYSCTPWKKTLAVLKRLSELRGDVEIQIAQFFASYCDQLFRWEVGTLMENDAAANRADYVVKLVSLIDDKDIFLEHYKLHLSRRLLFLPPSQLNLDAERVMFRKMQQVFGRMLTHNLEAMLRDHESSTSVSEEFRQTLAHQSLPSKFRVRLLTAVHWKMFRILQLQPVPSLAQAMQAFTGYYVGLHPSRALRWIHSLGTATLHAVFPKGTKEVIANTVQSHILILVSDAYNAIKGVADETKDDANPNALLHRGSIPGESIAKAMGMNFTDLRVHLTPLVMHKVYNLLVRVEGPTRSTGGAAAAPLQPEDEFMVNVGYTHKMRKFKLPVARTRSGQEAKGTAHAEVDEDSASLSKVVEDTRRLQVDAAVIRIMKSRRTLRYQELLDATIQQLSKLFVPTSRLLKMQLEDLVGRGFLRRNEEDTSIFEYIS